MLSFPIHNAALDLKGKPPEELPHGRLPVPPVMGELLERERQQLGLTPEAFAASEQRLLNLWTVTWYFDGLGHEVIYRETPEGPEVVAVGYDEMFAFRRDVPPEEQRKYEGYLGY